MRTTTKKKPTNPSTPGSIMLRTRRRFFAPALAAPDAARRPSSTEETPASGFQNTRAITAGGYSSLRNTFLCGFQICKPCRSIM